MTTPILGTTELVASQSQPHVTINAAIRRIEQALSHNVLSLETLTTPPGTPAEGDMHVVGTDSAGATGAWAGHDNEIAYYSGGGWYFITPKEGFLIWTGFESSPGLYVYTSGAWTLLV